MRIDWHQVYAAIWRSKSQKLKPVVRLDPVRLDELQGIDRQKQAIIANTQHFLEGKTSKHALLWGARGTGKSSVIKALLNEMAPKGLRIIQIDKDIIKAIGNYEESGKWEITLDTKKNTTIEKYFTNKDNPDVPFSVFERKCEGN